MSGLFSVPNMMIDAAFPGWTPPAGTVLLLGAKLPLFVNSIWLKTSECFSDQSALPEHYDHGDTTAQAAITLMQADTSIDTLLCHDFDHVTRDYILQFRPYLKHIISITWDYASPMSVIVDNDLPVRTRLLIKTDQVRHGYANSVHFRTSDAASYVITEIPFFLRRLKDNVRASNGSHAFGYESRVVATGVERAVKGRLIRQNGVAVYHTTLDERVHQRLPPVLYDGVRYLPNCSYPLTSSQWAIVSRTVQMNDGTQTEEQRAVATAGVAGLVRQSLSNTADWDNWTHNVFETITNLPVHEMRAAICTFGEACGWNAVWLTQPPNNPTPYWLLMLFSFIFAATLSGLFDIAVYHGGIPSHWLGMTWWMLLGPIWCLTFALFVSLYRHRSKEHGWYARYWLAREQCNPVQCNSALLLPLKRTHPDWHWGFNSWRLTMAIKRGRSWVWVFLYFMYTIYLLSVPILFSYYDGRFDDVNSTNFTRSCRGWCVYEIAYAEVASPLFAVWALWWIYGGSSRRRVIVTITCVYDVVALIPRVLFMYWVFIDLAYVLCAMALYYRGRPMHLVTVVPSDVSRARAVQQGMWVEESPPYVFRELMQKLGGKMPYTSSVCSEMRSRCVTVVRYVGVNLLDGTPLEKIRPTPTMHNLIHVEGLSKVAPVLTSEAAIVDAALCRYALVTGNRNSSFEYFACGKDGFGQACMRMLLKPSDPLSKGDIVAAFVDHQFPYQTARWTRRVVPHILKTQKMAIQHSLFAKDERYVSFGILRGKKTIRIIWDLDPLGQMAVSIYFYAVGKRLKEVLPASLVYATGCDSGAMGARLHNMSQLARMNTGDPTPVNLAMDQSCITTGALGDDLIKFINNSVDIIEQMDRQGYRRFLGREIEDFLVLGDMAPFCSSFKVETGRGFVLTGDPVYIMLRLTCATSELPFPVWIHTLKITVSQYIKHFAWYPAAARMFLEYRSLLERCRSETPTAAHEYIIQREKRRQDYQYAATLTTECTRVQLQRYTWQLFGLKLDTHESVIHGITRHLSCARFVDGYHSTGVSAFMTSTPLLRYCYSSVAGAVPIFNLRMACLRAASSWYNANGNRHYFQHPVEYRDYLGKGGPACVPLVQEPKAEHSDSTLMSWSQSQHHGMNKNMSVLLASFAYRPPTNQDDILVVFPGGSPFRWYGRMADCTAHYLVIDPGLNFQPPHTDVTGDGPIFFSNRSWNNTGFTTDEVALIGNYAHIYVIADAYYTKTDFDGDDLDAEMDLALFHCSVLKAVAPFRPEVVVLKMGRSSPVMYPVFRAESDPNPLSPDSICFIPPYANINGETYWMMDPKGWHTVPDPADIMAAWRVTLATDYEVPDNMIIEVNRYEDANLVDDRLPVQAPGSAHRSGALHAKLHTCTSHARMWILSFTNPPCMVPSPARMLACDTTGTTYFSLAPRRILSTLETSRPASRLGITSLKLPLSLRALAAALVHAIGRIMKLLHSLQPSFPCDRCVRSVPSATSTPEAFAWMQISAFSTPSNLASGLPLQGP